MKKLTVDQVRRHRAGRLGLDGPGSDIATIADFNCGLHATSFLTPYLSLMARHVKTPFQSLNKAQLVDRNLTRLRAMRGNLFIVPAARIPMLLGAFRTKPRILKKLYENWRIRPESILKAKMHLENVIEKKPRNLRELHSRLPAFAKKKLTSPRSERSNLLLFLIQVLQYEGKITTEKIVINNSVRNAARFISIKATFPDLPKAPSDEQCVLDLIHWYFDTQGPASFDDLAWWSGLGKIALKKVIDQVKLEEVEVGINERKLFLTPKLLKSIQSKKLKEDRRVRLLPYEDPYLKAHKDRALILSGVPEATVFQNKEARPTVCMDGRIVGLWRFVEHGEDLRIGVELFDKHIDPEELNKAKELAIKFTRAHFQKSLDNLSKGIFTGTEPYA